MKKQIQIAIAEDHFLFRQGLLSLFKDYNDIKVLFDVSNGKEVMEQLKTQQPNVLFLDIDMPEMRGDEVLQKVKVKYPSIKVIMLSQYYQEPYILEFIKMGASSYLSKNAPIDKMMEAIHAVHETGFYFDSKISAAMARLINTTNALQETGSPPILNLTSREIEIIKLICDGKSSKEIADLLEVSKRTIDNHRFTILKKTNTKNAMELANYAIHNKIIPPGINKLTLGNSDVE